MSIHFHCYGLDKKKFKPVSASYENVLKCYPDLKSEELVSHVDLKLLKQIIDEKYPTTRSYLRFRRVQYQSPQMKKHILTLFLVGNRLEKASTKMTVEVIDSSGQSVEKQEARRVNPSPEEINVHLQGASIEFDETSFVDIKFNGHEMRFSINSGQLTEIVLSDSKKRLSCESQKDLGIICSCSTKSS